MRPKQIDYERYIAMVQWGKNCQWDHEKIAKEGPYQVADVGMTMIQLRANRDLLALAQRFGESEVELANIINKSEKGIDWIWNDSVNCYCSRDLITGLSSAMVTSASFLDFYAGVGSQEQRNKLEQHLQRINEHCEYFLPGYDPQAEKFNPICYWRGPVWLVVNFMLLWGWMKQVSKIGEKKFTLIHNDWSRKKGFGKLFAH